MCGICGFINYTNLNHTHDLLKMMKRIDHRGPDDEGKFICNETGLNLGHKRLSIIDVSNKGKQPMISSNKRLIIIFNGEIYNHIELKKIFFRLDKQWHGTSDTEILLECFQLLGIEKTLSIIKGMFAFALYDQYDRSLYLSRDRFGEKPLYYSFTNNYLYFSSELNSLKNISSIDYSLDFNSIQHQLNFSYIPNNASIYKNIKQITPGHCVKFSLKHNHILISKLFEYWNTYNEIQSSLNNQYQDNKEAENDINDQLNNTISSQLVSDVEVGTFFSGGIDSTIVTSKAAEINKSKLKSFTIGFDDDQYDESKYAEKITKFLNIKLKIRKINNSEIINTIPKLNDIYSEPFADPSQIPTILLSEMTSKQGIKVVLTGDGGDELFGGYNRYFIYKKLSFLKYIPYNLRKIISDVLLTIPSKFWTILFNLLKNSYLIDNKIPNFNNKVIKLLNILRFKNEEEIFIIILRTLNLTEIMKNNFHNLDLISKKTEKFERIEDFMMFFDTVNYLPGDILVKVDRATMKSSLEARAPFLDHELFSKAWRIKDDLKFSKNSGKIILKNILSKNIDINLFDRPKMGFGVPLDSILRNQLKDWCYDLLDSNNLHDFGIFDQTKLKKIKENFFENNIGSYIPIWNILIFSDWLNKNA